MTVDTYSTPVVVVDYGPEPDEDYVKVTRWKNCEGVDVHLYDGVDDAHFTMTFEQWQAFRAAMEAMLDTME